VPPRSLVLQLQSISGYISSELAAWRQKKYIDWVQLIEGPLGEAFHAPVWRRTAEKYVR